MAARDENFLDGPGSTVDPFTGLAPALTPEEEATQRLLKLRYSAQQTANRNAQYGQDRERAQTGRANITPEEKAAYDQYAREHHLGEYAYGLGHNLAQDPLTMGILAAPALVTGAGAAIGGAGALGFGEAAGVGSLATPAGESAVVGANAAPAMGAPFTMASPFPAAGAAGVAAGAAGGAGGAAGSGGAAGFFNSVGKPALQALAPLAIQQLTKGPTKEQKQLIELQKQMALEAQQRQGQLQDQRMNQLGQQVLAFNPTNQLMAQMYGPQAAFSPEQAAQMVQGQEPSMDPNILNYTGNDQNILRQKQEMIRRHNEWQQAESQRRDMMMNNFQAPGPGPAPINMPAPQAARRF